MKEETVFLGILIGVVLTIIGLVVRLTWSDGQIDYCYVRFSEFKSIEESGNIKIKGYCNLYGHVPWRNDRFIAGQISSLDEIKRNADLLMCPLN